MLAVHSTAGIHSLTSLQHALAQLVHVLQLGKDSLLLVRLLRQLSTLDMLRSQRVAP